MVKQWNQSQKSHIDITTDMISKIGDYVMSLNLKLLSNEMYSDEISDVEIVNIKELEKRIN